jgi:hypothetical protein
MLFVHDDPKYHITHSDTDEELYRSTKNLIKDLGK